MNTAATKPCTVREAADLLGTTPGSVRKLCPAWEKEGKAYRLSDSPESEWRVPRSTIDVHKRRHAVEQPSVKGLSRSEREALLLGG